MNQAFWRYSLSLLTLFALFIAFGDAFDRNRFGLPGFAVHPVSEHEGIVSGLTPGSAAARAGLRNGDRIRADWIREIAVLSAANDVSVRAGENIEFYDQRNERTIRIAATPLPEIFSADRIVAHVLRVLGLLLALILFWSKPADRAGRALGGFLLAFALQGWGYTGSFFLSIPQSQFISDVGFVSMLLTLVLFACWFPERNPTDLRRAIAAAACGFAVCALIVRIDAIHYAYAGSGLSLLHRAYIPLFSYVEPVVFSSLAIAALAVDFRTSSPLDRLRLEWVSVGMALQIYASIVFGITFPQVLSEFPSASNLLGNVIYDGAQIIGTGAMLYAFFQYRVLDITFAINRATVFAVLSTIIVGIFVIVEYLISKFVESQSRLTGLAITLLVALAIGISLQKLHQYVDRVVDGIVFRRRHRDEEAIRAFGRRARFITDEGTLEQCAVETLDRHAHSNGSALYLRAESGDYWCVATSVETTKLIDRNDTPVVMMKDSGSSCYVNDPGAAVRGELVLPMLVRGELFGFAACGKRRIREVYAPDELDAMTYMVDRIGIQLDALRTARMQSMLGEITNLVRAHLLLGGDGASLIAHIAEITGAGHGSVPAAKVEPE